MKIYSVKEVDYDCYGNGHEGAVIEMFSNRDEAEAYCYRTGLSRAMGGGWPTIMITENEISVDRDILREWYLDTGVENV